jgi:hypothetical protein
VNSNEIPLHFSNFFEKLLFIFRQMLSLVKALKNPAVFVCHFLEIDFVGQKWGAGIVYRGIIVGLLGGDKGYFSDRSEK